MKEISLLGALLSLTQNLSYIIMKLEYNNRKRMLEYGRDRAAIYLTFMKIRFGKHNNRGGTEYVLSSIIISRT